MQTGLPSQTAQRVALRRAAHQILDHPKVFDDPLALSILGPEEASALAASPEQARDPGSKFLRAFMAVRSRYAEDRLAAAVANRVDQYVVLGAGLDTFAYRNPYSPEQLRIFEVDHPATQAWKRERLEIGGIPVPSTLTFASLDFENQSLEAGLAAAGLNTGKPAFFSWIGVTPYLTTGAFEATLRFIAGMPRGSGVTFDYAVDRSLLNPIEVAALNALSERVNSAGEPFRLFLAPANLVEQLHAIGFTEIEDLSSPEINARYFDNRTDGLRVIGGLAHLLSATV